MGAPSTPTIVQQTAKPSQSEKDAKADALKQKQDALAVIRQDVFARSQGLRGAASMYDYAGKTPWLAKDPVPTTAKPPSPPPPPPPPGKKPGRDPWADRTTLGPVNDLAHNPFPIDQNDARGPYGDRDPGSRSIGGAPHNTGAVPGGPDANRQLGGHPQETGLYPGANTARTPQDYYASTPTGAKQLDVVRQKLGLPPKPPAPAKPPQTTMLPNQASIVRAKLGLPAKPANPVAPDPHMRPADTAVKAAPTTMLPNQGVIAQKLGIAPGPAATVGGGTASGALAKPVTSPAPATKTTAPTPVQANLGTPKPPAPPPAKPPTLATPAPKLTGIVRPTTPQPLSLVNRGSGGNR